MCWWICWRGDSRREACDLVRLGRRGFAASRSMMRSSIKLLKSPRRIKDESKRFKNGRKHPDSGFSLTSVLPVICPGGLAVLGSSPGVPAARSPQQVSPDDGPGTQTDPSVLPRGVAGAEPCGARNPVGAPWLPREGCRGASSAGTDRGRRSGVPSPGVGNPPTRRVSLRV